MNDGHPTDKIAVRCECGARLQAPVHAAGRLVRCPRCRAVAVLPTPAGGTEDGQRGAGTNVSPTADQALLDELEALLSRPGMDDTDLLDASA